MCGPSCDWSLFPGAPAWVGASGYLLTEVSVFIFLCHSALVYSFLLQKMSGKKKGSGLSMVQLKAENDNLAKQLEDLRALVTANIPAKDTSEQVDSVEIAVGNDPDPVEKVTTRGRSKRSASATAGKTPTEDVPSPPVKKRMVDSSTITVEVDGAVQDQLVTQREELRVLNKQSVGQALEKAMEEDGSTGDFLSNYVMEGSLVDDKIKVKIVSHQYVDLMSLQCRAEQGGAFHLYDNGNALQFNPYKPRAPANFVEWLKLFCTYSAIYLDAHPEHGAGIASYISRIANMSQKQPPSYLWRQYDENFRRVRARNTALPWFKVHTGILDYAKETIQNISRANARRQVAVQKKQHEATQATNSEKTNGGRARMCFEFNDSNKGCKRLVCKFQHKCMKCGGNHPQSVCKPGPRAPSAAMGAPPKSSK